MRRLCLCLFLVSVVLFATKSPAYQTSCGTQTYDTEFAICCSGVVSSIPYRSYRQCCGTQSYDPQSYTCCNGVLTWTGSTYHQCCGTTAYDPSFYRCCGGRLLLGSGWC
jgi:hypothetical protein